MKRVTCKVFKIKEFELTIVVLGKLCEVKACFAVLVLSSDGND